MRRLRKEASVVGLVAYRIFCSFSSLTIVSGKALEEAYAKGHTTP